MKSRSAKFYLMLITYAIILFVISSNVRGVLSFFQKALNIFSPFLYAIAIAFVLNILMKSFEDRVFFWIKTKKPKKTAKIKRICSILSTYVFVLLIISMLILFIFPQLSSSIVTLTSNIPSYISSLNAFATNISQNYSLPNEILTNVFKIWDDFLKRAGDLVSSSLPMVFNFTKGITSGVVNIFLAIVLSIYMLYGKEKLLRNIKQFLYVVLPKKTFELSLLVGKKTNKTFQSFIAGQLTEAVIIGVLCFLGMTIIKIPYALLISTIVGVTSIIPIFGAFIGTIPSALIIFIVSPIKSLWFIIFIIALQQFEGNIIYPKVVGTSIGLSGLWVLLAMIIGSNLFGFVGLLLGIPAFAVIYSLVSTLIHIKMREKLKS